MPTTPDEVMELIRPFGFFFEWSMAHPAGAELETPFPYLLSMAGAVMNARRDTKLTPVVWCATGGFDDET